MYVISGNYGNDTIAAIQWAKESALASVVVVSIDTGWAAPSWPERVSKAEFFVKQCGYNTIRLIAAVTFAELVRDRKEFPTLNFTWCAGLLKGLPLLEWLDDVDPQCEATIIIGKRRASSHANLRLPEFIEDSEYHGGRRVWSPLYLHDNSQRDALITRAGFPILAHPSLECEPCVVSQAADLAQLSEQSIAKVAALENALGMPMFSSSVGGIAQRVQQAKENPCDEQALVARCGMPFGCGL